jgi:hypothetical protein
MSGIRNILMLCCGLSLPWAASALDESVGRVRLTDPSPQWRLVDTVESPAAALSNGGAIPSQTKVLAFRDEGGAADQVVVIVRASTGGSNSGRVSFTQPCDDAANLVATRMTSNVNLPDCMKLSGPVVTEKFLEKNMLPVREASSRGAVKLPQRVRYFDIVVAADTGSFVSVGGLIDAKATDIEGWVRALAEALRRGNMSIRGTVEMPTPPVLSAPR